MHTSKVKINPVIDSSLNLFISHLSPTHLLELDLLGLNFLYVSKSLGDLTIQLCAAVKVNSTNNSEWCHVHSLVPRLSQLSLGTRLPCTYVLRKLENYHTAETFH